MTLAMRIKEYAALSRPRFCDDSVCENNGTSQRPHSAFDEPLSPGMPYLVPTRASGYLSSKTLPRVSFPITTARWWRWSWRWQRHSLLVRRIFYRAGYHKVFYLLVWHSRHSWQDNGSPSSAGICGDFLRIFREDAVFSSTVKKCSILFYL